MAARHALWRLGASLATRLALGVVVSCLYLSGLFEVADLKLLDARYPLVQRAAESDLVLVAVDPPSLQQIGYWPWPRSLHAFLLERLTEAGAARVAFDIDFSSRSRERNDAAFERALAAFPGQVILPGFVQNADPLHLDGALVSTLPLDRFLRHVTVASINVVPDEDGLVRRMTTTAPLGGRRVPSLSAVLAQDVDPGREAFTIDYGIRLEDIPTVSYRDVLTGDFEAGLFEGRTVLVGATAFELGDVLPVPVYSALPGVMLQALATESLIQGRTLVPLPKTVVVLGILALSLLMGGRCRGSDWRRGLLLTLGLPPLLFAASCLIQGATPFLLDVVPWTVTIIGAYGVKVLGILHRQNAHLLAQRFALLRKERFMNSVVEHTFDAIITVDPEGRITSLNTSAKAILAGSDRELQGHDIGDFLLRPEGGGETACSVACLARVAARAEPCELLGRRWTGDLFPLDVAVSCFEEKQQATYIVLLRDITARKQAEAAAEASRQQLVAAKERAEAADRAKSEFLANMSHELRTPLNAVIGFSEIMKDELLGPIGSESYRGYAQDIHESGVHLLSVINDILDISKIETGNIVLSEESFCLGETAEACVRMVRSRAESADVKLQAEIAASPLEVCGDERLIKQSILNILSNALKFTPPNGCVTLKMAREEGGAVAIVVTDTGPGIATEDLPAILEPFRQLESSLTRSFEGTGLGLPLTKAFLELHGGHMEIDSEAGQGTKVSLVLPAERVLSSVAEVTARRAAS